MTPFPYGSPPQRNADDMGLPPASRPVSDYRRHQAWIAGAKAGELGQPKSANKCQRGTIYYDDWCDGYESVRPLAHNKEGTDSTS